MQEKLENIIYMNRKEEEKNHNLQDIIYNCFDERTTTNKQARNNLIGYKIFKNA